jgi:hypothetical protein
VKAVKAFNDGVMNLPMAADYFGIPAYTIYYRARRSKRFKNMTFPK